MLYCQRQGPLFAWGGKLHSCFDGSSRGQADLKAGLSVITRTVCGMLRLQWRRCEATSFQSPPAARMGHIAVTVDASETWGDEIVVVHGGLGEAPQARSVITHR